jgi:hypothetical protein
MVTDRQVRRLRMELGRGEVGFGTSTALQTS